MAQEILVTYKADVDKVTADVNKFIAANEKLGSTQGQVQKELDKTTKAADKLDKELAQTGKSAKGATDKVKGFSKSANTELSALSSTVQSIGLGIAGALGAAFTVDAVIQFGKASINAFLEAQENAEKLRFTITQVGGESEAAFQRLIDQSEKLQKITIFSDDSIQQAQNALATFGLTADQIEDLLPKLADFASATKTDIVQAANQVGQGLQGAGREFKKYGIEVSATASALDNYNAITQGMVRFTGAASAEAETLTGQLKQQANAADELQEQLGSKLAPIYVRLKTVLFEAALGILGFNKAAEQLAQTNNDAIANNILQTAEKLKASGKDVVAEFSKRADEIRAINEQTADNIEQKNREIRDRIAELSKQKLEVNPDDDRIIKGLQSQIEQYNKIIQVNDQRLKGLTKVIETEQNALKNSARLLTVEQLRVKSLTDLNDLLKENSKGNDLISQQNVDNIRKVIAEQQKLAEASEKSAAAQAEAIRGLKSEIDKVNAETAKIKIGEIDPKTYAEAIAKIEQLSEAAKKAVDDDINSQIEKLKAEQKYTTEAGKLIDQLREKRKELIDENRDQQITLLDQKTIDANKQLLAQLESLNFEEALLINADVIDANNRKLAKSFEELNEAVSSSASGAQVSSIQQRIKTETDLLNKAIANEAKIRIEAAQAEQQRRLDEADTIGIAENEKKVIVQETNLEIQRINKDTTDKQLANIEKLNQALREGGQSDVVLWFERNEQILDSSQQLFDALIELNSQYYDNRLQQINAEKDAQISALDFEQEKISENLSKRRISELEAQRQTEALTAKRVQVQAQAAKKERDLKRKQAETEKAAAIIQIIINTAQAVSRAYAEGGPFAGAALAALVGALGAAQLALVAAQPIPYEKGSKDTGSKGHMARVGEKGEEIVFMPAHSKVLPAKQTQNFGAALDAMYDNRFDKWVMEQYTAPVLVAQQKQHEKDREQTFVKNIAQSFSVTNDFNTGNLEKAIRRGQIILNADDIGQSVAKHLQTDIYRR